jgi:hypothetical protein
MSESDDPYETLKPPPFRPDRPVRRPQSPPPAPAAVPAADLPLLEGEARPAPVPSEPARTPPTPLAQKPAPRPLGGLPPTKAPPLAAKPAGPFCQLFPLGDEARRLLNDKFTLLAYLYLLMKQRLHLDAVRLLAHALPRREAVSWACHCARSRDTTAASPAEANALKAAEGWLLAPSEANRRVCGGSAAVAGYGTAAGSAALAVFLTGGSIAPPLQPAAPASEHVGAQAVANAVVFAALVGEPAGAGDRFFLFLKEGLALLSGAGKTSEGSGGAVPIQSV